MARIDGKEVQVNLMEAFGLASVSDLTPRQVFLLVKIIKHCRLRCRNNAALNNWLKRAFPALDIRTKKVLSKYPKTPGETYDALVVVNPNLKGAEAEGTEGEDSDE